MFYDSLQAVKRDLQQHAVTCVQLVQYYLSNIRQHQHLNAFIEVFDDEALQRAAFIDEKLKSGTAGRLAGMVLSIKDVFCYKHHKVSAASKMLESFSSIYTATVLERLLQEDAIFIGRTNCDEFAMGSANENSAFGHVLNGFDNSRVSGGSSGGAAVSVQMDMCLAAIGSDTGGSVRQPASFCGLVGIKPTYGRISRHGLIAYASSFDQPGIFTHQVDDAALLLEIAAGADAYDSTASLKPVETYSSTTTQENKYQLAFFPETSAHEKVDAGIRIFMDGFYERLRTEGHKITSVSFPYLDYLVPAYYVLTTAEASANLARYDGIRYGYRHKDSKELKELYVKSRSEGFGWEVKRRIMLGTFVLSEGYYDAYYGRAQKLRRLILDATEEILAHHDFIMLPTTPSVAFKIGAAGNDPVQSFLADIFTVQANLTGMPAISLPLGVDDNGMPFGVQVIAKRFDEKRLLSFSKYLLENFRNEDYKHVLK